jgi:hypothetical protein
MCRVRWGTRPDSTSCRLPVTAREGGLREPSGSHRRKDNVSRKASLIALLVLGVVGLVAVGSAAGSSSTSRSPAPRVGASGTIGPVCGRKHGDGTLRFIRFGHRCRKGETYFYLHVRFKNNRRGLRGLTGLAGPRGAQGIAGQIGATGPMGLPGLDGAVGPMGPTGAEGDQGIPGETGAQGEVGPTGATGAAGAQGEAGPTGAEGPKGDTGAVGPTGAIGPAGPAGAAGPAGSAGAKGETGATGPAGPTGPQGPIGDIGSIETVVGGTNTGSKQFTVTCPVGKHAVSGGFNIQGSVTASFRSDSTGDPTGTTAWTIIQSSGAALSGTEYVYCA